ncbi:MAG: RNA polymerase sigma factor [Verrucomicrobiia bacterium]
MPLPETTAGGAPSGREWFSTTHWSTVLTAGAKQSDRSARALEKLCQTYWYPLYAYVRRCGYPTHDAEDLIQEFLARFVARNHIANATRDKGRFRFYLLGALKHFLSDARDHERRLKRGGGRPVISLDAQNAEHLYYVEPRDDLSPDRLFDRRWAVAVLEQVLARLEREYKAEGKATIFQRLKVFLTENATGAYPQAACELGLSEGATRVAVHRLRRRYGQMLRLEIAHTVGCPDQVLEEMRDLRAALL